MGAERLTKKSSANFAAQARLLSKPTQEFLGLGAAEFSLALRFDVQMGLNPTNELANVHDLMDGKAYLLVLNHKPQGYFVLTSIEESWLYTDTDGRLLVAEVQIQLLESNQNVH